MKDSVNPQIMPDNLKQQVLSGLFWQYLDSFGSQFIRFAISIILARLLAPAEFGMLAILMVFINIGVMLIDGGFQSALIQKKDVDDEDCDSVFWFNIVVATSFYIAVFFAAPFVARYYDHASLCILLRCLGLSLIINSLSMVHMALLDKRMLFRFSFRISWIAMLSSAGIGIGMAYAGFGVWALVMQQLSSSIAVSFMRWVYIPYRPHFRVVMPRLKILLNFAWKLLCSNVMYVVSKNIVSLVIGKRFDLKTLAFYERGSGVPALVMNALNGSLGKVMFPAFSSIQHNPERLKHVARQSVKCSMFFVAPLLFCLFALAEPFVSVVLGEKWLPAVIFIQIGVFSYLFWPLHTINLQVLQACGRSDITLKLEIIKDIQTLLIVVIACRFGVIALVLALSIASFPCFVYNAWYNKRLIDYSFFRQLLDVTPIFLSAAAAAGVIMWIGTLMASPWIKFLGLPFVFAAVYLVISAVFCLIPAPVSNLLIFGYRKISRKGI